MLDRRKFLYLSVGTIVIAGIPLSLSVFKNWTPDDSERELFGQIANDYFRLFPNEKEKKFLESAIGEKKLLSTQIPGEFARGECVIVGNWYLSRTEARVIALLALEDS